MLRFATIAVILLAVIDGLTHLSLNLLVTHHFTGNTYSNLFTLNFVGYVVVIAAYIWAQSASLSTRKLMDGIIVLFPIIALVGWVVLTHAKGNPMGLAYLAKPVEVLEIIAIALHFTALSQEPSARVAHA